MEWPSAPKNSRFKAQSPSFRADILLHAHRRGASNIGTPDTRTHEHGGDTCAEEEGEGEGEPLQSLEDNARFDDEGVGDEGLRDVSDGVGSWSRSLAKVGRGLGGRESGGEDEGG